MSFAIRVLTVGKPDAQCQLLVDRYGTLIRPYARISIDHLRPSAERPTPEAVKVEEGRRLLSALGSGEYLVALSAEGKALDSIAFSRWMNRVREKSVVLAMVIGGAFGLSAGFKAACWEVLSLSPMTFPHSLCLALLMEQMYRAFTILKGHPYHK
jgi:23S rRNA (pseudouridine1915-N3)-methyltransferase